MNNNAFFVRSKVSYGITIAVLVFAVFGVGYYVGSNQVSAEFTSNKNATPNMGMFWNVWKTLDSKFISAKDINSETRVWGAIKGLTDSFKDPYTMYFTPNEAKQFNDSLSGEFYGIGIEIGIQEKVLTVIAPIKDTPSFKAGIKSGDKIIEIDGKTTEGLTIDDAISRIKGEKGTPVDLTVFRAGEKTTRKFTLIRDLISVPPIETKIEKGVFEINFSSFSATSAKEFEKAIVEFQKSNSTKLLIDMRGNPGGYLDAAVDIGSWFVPQGKVIVSEDFGSSSEPHSYRSKGYNLLKKPSKIIILVDGGSASAAEILSGALKEYGIATLVGQKTYGKGSVQEVISFEDKSELKVTVARWLTPNGVSISEKGIIPDVVVEIPKDIKAGQDPIKDKAFSLFN